MLEPYPEDDGDSSDGHESISSASDLPDLEAVWVEGESSDDGKHDSGSDSDDVDGPGPFSDSFVPFSDRAFLPWSVEDVEPGSRGHLDLQFAAFCWAFLVKRAS